MLNTTDNNCGIAIVDLESITHLKTLADKTIGTLVSEDNPDLLVFPSNFKEYGDRINEQPIFSLQEAKLTTGNIMGFIGLNGSDVTIRSRFAQKDEDYFLHYMLQKVFSINLFELKHGVNKDSVFDFLLYLFPFYLKKALRQGLYKEYHKAEYNDSNVRGTIDINRHLRKNIPFVGNVAYRVREHSFDNKLTQLIRHTIEFIRQHQSAERVLNLDAETQQGVNAIMQATSTYNSGQRTVVVNKNLRSFSHPYFFEYKALQKICVQILKHEGLKYGKEKDKAYGLLFDGAWLWEEYLNTFLKDCGFKHPQNTISEGAIYMFSNSKRSPRYPDFWKENFILDAKYKMEINGRDDLNQIVSYMYIQKAQIGGFIRPSKYGKTYKTHFGQLNGYGGDVYTWILSIPQEVGGFPEFCQLMSENEIEMQSLIKEQSFPAIPAF